MSGKIEANKRIIISVFGETKSTARAGLELLYDCPFCEERRGKADKDKKLYVNAKTMKYWCFKCEAKGSLGMDKFTRSILGEGNSDVYKELFEWERQSRGQKTEEEDEGDNTFFIPHQKLKPGTLPYDYMTRVRGISPEDIVYYDMREGDLFNPRHFGRVVIPNRVINNVFTDMYVGRGYLGQELRYSNPPDSARRLIVFNLHRIPKGEPITIAEGTISAIFTGRNGVCTYGKYVTSQQMKSILDNKPSALNIALDPDAQEQAVKLCSQLVSITDIPINLVQMPEETDPADLGYEGFQEYLKSAHRYKSKLYFDLMNIFK
ncbi:DNA primase [Bacillus phage SP-15]|uniref:DNA primase n=1 Tax=Bacillus phage SP-15 TaxID=1792032 RepID=A0A127AW78_9CAUD|nr:DNA primase [Bacillus phage SP-15]AMM44890.1 DNA primase [Bacillus phage SP-15]